MPNDGLMACKLSKEQRIGYAANLRDIRSGKRIEYSASFDVASGKSKSTMKVDGREARNYMNEAMENGDCVITGYGFSQ